MFVFKLDDQPALTQKETVNGVNSVKLKLLLVSDILIRLEDPVVIDFETALLSAIATGPKGTNEYGLIMKPIIDYLL